MKSPSAILRIVFGLVVVAFWKDQLQRARCPQRDFGARRVAKPKKNPVLRARVWVPFFHLTETKQRRL